MTDVVAVRDVFSVHRTNEGDAAALQGATLTVTSGESVCVLGPSGAGKTTLLRVIAGLQTPSAGAVRVLGRDIGRARARTRARIRHQSLGLLGQHSGSSLCPDLSLRDCVALPLALRGAGRGERRRRAEALLDAAGLSDRGARCRRSLRRRAPAGGPMPGDRPPSRPAARRRAHGRARRGQRQAILRLIAELGRAEGTTVIVVSHDPAAASAADRSVRMRDGRIVEELGDAPGGGHRGGAHRLAVAPPALLRAAGINERAQVRLADGGLLVSAAGTRPSRGAAVPAACHADSRTPGVDSGRDRAARRRPHAWPRPGAADGLARAQPVPGRRAHERGGGSVGIGQDDVAPARRRVDRPDSGTVLVDAHDLAADDAESLAALRSRRIGYLAQEPTPVGFLSAEENIVLALRSRGWDEGEARAQAADVLARVGLSERARQRAGRLSAGEAQRLALARALASARGTADRRRADLAPG